VAEVVDLVSTAEQPPASMGMAIARRLSFLPAEVLTVLRAASILGGEFAVTDLAVILERPATALVDPLGQATAAGGGPEARALLAFRHPLIRTALYEEIPAPVRSALHRHAAQALAEAGAPVDKVALHLLASPARRDGWLASWLAEHAQALGNRAPETAATLLG